MLRPSHLLDAMRLVRAAGERIYGHFDHDAHQAVGPTETPDASSMSMLHVSTTLENSVEPFEEYQDTRTGETLYKPRSR